MDFRLSSHIFGSMPTPPYFLTINVSSSISGPMEEPEVFESRLDDLRKGPALDMAPPPEEVQTKTRDTTQAGTPEFTGPRSWPPKLIKENAPACLSVAHFPELKEEKGIALMAGEYDDKIIKKSEALNLVKQMSMFYGKSAGERYLLLRTFHANPGAFDHMQLIEEYKRNKDYLENNLY
ncbi:ATPF1-like protein [Mya arenaria]|uniref:ATPF1-like protein n=1 Tax=Mya arenaria TaxID=6604 RepID=A0ABY7FV60_MYAAR|nr:ATPF1-like protein [Mya arenaria]